MHKSTVTVGGNLFTFMIQTTLISCF